MAYPYLSIAFVLKWIPVGIVYAIWDGVGIALTSVTVVVLSRQMLDGPAIIGIGSIIAGAAIINLYSNVTVN